jgi:hypothetical protein
MEIGVSFSTQCGSCTLPFCWTIRMMLRGSHLRRLIVPLALVALLLVATTAATAWHHHSNSTDTSCSICHINHSPCDQPVTDNRVADLAPLGLQAEPPENDFSPAPSLRRIPARAPPAL